MLRIKNLHCYYGKTQVLKGVSLHIRKGEFVTLIGANGAGKTTLMNAVMGIIKAAQGTIVIDGSESTNSIPEKMVSRGIALVPEGRQLFAPMSVRDNLILGGYHTKRKRRAGKDDAKNDAESIAPSSVREQTEKNLQKVYSLFPLLEERARQYAGTLSGGEQQMLAIGRALMSNPKMILLDEPSMGLAPLIVKNIFDALVELHKDGTTVLLVEQSARMALKISDRGYVMETGKIILEGSREDLMDNQEIKRAYLGK